MHDIELKMMRAVQGLALDPIPQQALFPQGLPAGEELAIEFGEAFDPFWETLQGADPERRSALLSLNDALDDASTHCDEDFWFDAGRLDTDPQWHSLRELARRVLATFGWPNEAPPRNDAIYVTQTAATRNR